MALRVLGIVLFVAVLSQSAAAQDCSHAFAEASGSIPASSLERHLVQERARQANLPALDSSEAPEGTTEIRIWYGDGPVVGTGLVIRGSPQGWTALTYTYDRTSQCFVPSPGPANVDWERVWNSVGEQTLLQLPESPTRAGSLVVEDGTFYLIELRTAGQYRTFMYLNPEIFRTDDDLVMLGVLSALLLPAGYAPPEIAN